MHDGGLQTLAVWRGALRAVLVAVVIGAALKPVRAQSLAAGERLVAAYSEQLSHVEGNELVWRDGTRMIIDDGQGHKTPEARLAAPDLKDMLAIPYPAGRASLPPPAFADPGRVRNAAFFDKMYGSCAARASERNLVEITWLAKTAPQKLKVTRVNGVAHRLQAVSAELETLPAAVRAFLSPSAGTFVCRPIAGTDRASAHGYGIAIDIAIARADYWRWARGGPRPSHAPVWRNRIPLQIVDVFERHGFIWGGKWSHYDTMHFEYRPELLAVTP